MKLRVSPLYEHSRVAGSDSCFWLIGDSRIARWNFSDTIAGCKTNNLGIEGQTAQQVYYRLKLNLEEAKPKLVLIQVGINDLKIIGLDEKNKLSIIDKTVDSIISSLEICRSNEVKPIFSTIIPTGRIPLLRKLVWSNEIDKAIIETNKRVVDYCVKNNIMVFNAYEILKNDHNKLNRVFEFDELHINVAAYSLLLDNLNRILNNK